MKPIVAIVGRPNVGKSTLFNRLIGERLAIIEDEPGITRDRLYADADWNGRAFTLVDTGGIQEGEEGTLEASVRAQAEAAIRESDLILFVVDARTGITPDDETVASVLRRSQKPVLLVVNKSDNLRIDDARYEFYRFGLGDPFPVSALHGTGTGDLLDAVVAGLPAGDEEAEDESLVRIAVIGRPNVGKSSLVNAILGEERVIVSDVAGTTRDAIDVLVRPKGLEQGVLLVDTAGMRRRAKIDEPVERYSVMRSLRAVDRSDVVLFVIDATSGVTEQDQRIAGYALEAGKAVVICVNKWDLVEKDDKTAKEFTERVRQDLAFLPFAPVVFISARTRQRVNRVLPLALDAWRQYTRRLSTAEVNEVMREAVALVPPPSDRGRRLKVLYVTQAKAKPPTFVFFVNNPELVHFSYRRYLENKLREAYGFEGTPIRLAFRARD